MLKVSWTLSRQIHDLSSSNTLLGGAPAILSTFGPATIFLPSKIIYLVIPILTFEHEPGTTKSYNLLITNHLD
jgi:hypothetical protein